MAKVSIVLSVYNGASTLVDALETTLSQTFSDFELIAIDDGSVDNSLDILQLYASRDERILVLRNEQNLGLANSLNKAIHISNSDYVMRMDQDDLNLSERLRYQMEVMNVHPEIGCISCYVDALFDSNVSKETRTGVQKFEQARRPLALSYELIPEKLTMHNVFHHGEVLFRKHLWKQIGGYRAEFTMSEDYDLWLRMIDHTSFYIVPLILYIRRFSDSNSSSIYSRLQRFTEKLAKECYWLRKTGKDDLIYAQTNFLDFINTHGLSQQFTSHIRGGL